MVLFKDRCEWEVQKKADFGSFRDHSGWFEVFYFLFFLIFLINRRQVFGYIVNLGLAVLVIIWSLPLFVFVAIGIAYVYSKFFIAYTNTARDIRRIESVLRSPIFSSFGELLDGVVTVRAFGEEKRFLINCTKRLDRATAAYWYMWMRWVIDHGTSREG